MNGSTALSRSGAHQRRTFAVAIVAMASSLTLSQVANVGAAAVAPARQAPAQTPATAGCRVTGQVTTMLPGPPQFNFGQRGQGAGQNAQAAAPAEPALVSTPLPGATIVVYQGSRLVVATSTEADGKFAIRFTPGQTFHVTAEMMSFAKVEKDITLAATPCDTTMNFQLSMLPRTAPGAAPAAAAGATTPASRCGSRPW